MRLRCPSDHVWDALPSLGDSRDCPMCGKAGNADLQADVPTYSKVYTEFKTIDPLEHEMAMNHRRWMEANHESVGGELNIKEKGPDIYRPFANRPRERKFY